MATIANLPCFNSAVFNLNVSSALLLANPNGSKRATRVASLVLVEFVGSVKFQSTNQQDFD